MAPALNGKLFALVAVAILLPVLALLYLHDGSVQTRVPTHPDEVRAVSVARAYAERLPRLREGTARPARIADVRGQWEVHFPPPPPWGATGTGGPIITVDKTTGKVVRARASD